MRGQGWPLGEEEDKRRGSNRVCGEKKGRKCEQGKQVHSLCGSMDCVVPTQMELLGAGQEPDSALTKTSAMGSLC